MKGKTVKASRIYNIEYFHDLGVENNFLARTQKALTIQESINKLDYVKIRTCIYQKTLLRVWKDKEQSGRAYLLTKGSLAEYIKNCRSVRWDLNKHFRKENIKMACKDMTRYSFTLVIVEMQIKTTVDHSIRPPDWLKLKMN